MNVVQREPCPACGGAGGGPFGRAGSGWDIETYECPVCQGEGTVVVAPAHVVRPGIAKTKPAAAPAKKTAKRRAK